MRSRPAQVAEQLGVGAAGVFQGVGEERTAIESSLVISSSRKMSHTTVRAGPVIRTNEDGAERQWSEDIAHHGSLSRACPHPCGHRFGRSVWYFAVLWHH
jgi:hypothetical protein